MLDIKNLDIPHGVKLTEAVNKYHHVLVGQYISRQQRTLPEQIKIETNLENPHHFSFTVIKSTPQFTEMNEYLTVKWDADYTALNDNYTGRFTISYYQENHEERSTEEILSETYYHYDAFAEKHYSYTDLFGKFFDNLFFMIRTMHWKKALAFSTKINDSCSNKESQQAVLYRLLSNDILALDCKNDINKSEWEFRQSLISEFYPKAKLKVSVSDWGFTFRVINWNGDCLAREEMPYHIDKFVQFDYEDAVLYAIFKANFISLVTKLERQYRPQVDSLYKNILITRLKEFDYELVPFSDCFEIRSNDGRTLGRIFKTEDSYLTEFGYFNFQQYLDNFSVVVENEQGENKDWWTVDEIIDSIRYGQYFIDDIDNFLQPLVDDGSICIENDKYGYHPGESVITRINVAGQSVLLKYLGSNQCGFINERYKISLFLMDLGISIDGAYRNHDKFRKTLDMIAKLYN